MGCGGVGCCAMMESPRLYYTAEVVSGELLQWYMRWKVMGGLVTVVH